MASLRARLTAALIALAAVGLLVLGAVTYVEQRSFLVDRVDQQVRAGVVPVSHAIDEQLGGTDDDGRYGFGRPGPPPGGDPGDHDAGGAAGLPTGTYGERRTADGTVLASTVLRFGQNVSVRPDLPAHLPVDHLLTVDGKGAGAPRYRVLMARTLGPGATFTVVAIPLRDVDQTLHRLLLVEGLVVVAVLALLALAGRAVVRVGLLPLDRMGHTAGAIAGGDLSHRVEATDPRTEVGRLGISLNAMLDRLEGAFAEREASADRLRRFLADASHELRTPLASIRGYAEILRMGAAADPADRDRATRRIEEEAARMGVLVEDLLTLARLDEVRDAPREPVDVAAVARDVAADARAAAPEREITVEVPETGARVLGQRDGLHQVLANLVRNAVVHTPAGSPVEVGVARRDGEVAVTVRDHGPGLPTGDEGVLFERFWRAEGGRTRGRAGAGLGLAIVAGIVAAHGGRVAAENAPDGGARFTVALPAAQSQEPPSTV